jgi:preprotein translocase subunit SecE
VSTVVTDVHDAVPATSTGGSSSGGRRRGTVDRTRGGRGRGAARKGNPLQRLLQFCREVIAELRKVIWPSRQELVTYVIVVVVFVSVLTAMVSGLDYLFTQGVLAVFG